MNPRPSNASAAAREDDARFMKAALASSADGLGRTWPNPSVGCVLVKDGVVLASARTADQGRPHAEARALEIAGAAARGATCYVTLEPCSHYGKTPPCAKGLIEAGVARVVCALDDPDPRVAGRGYAMLEGAGVAVSRGVLGDEAARLQEGYLTRQRLGRPRVLLKLATSLDGRIATASGESKWITGEAARRCGHRLRAYEDAIAVGIGTVLADDPILTCRAPGLEDRSPVRIVFDTEGRTPADSALIRTAGTQALWIVTAADQETRRLEDAGAIVVPVARGEGGLAMGPALEALGARGLTRLLVEGGGATAASLLRADLIDAIAQFQAPLALGGDARPAIGPLGVGRLDAAPRFRLEATERLGEDVLLTWRRA